MNPRGRRRGLLVCVCAVTLALCAGAPSSASAVTFGANLSRAADNPTACNDPGWFFFYTIDTCSVESQNLSTGESGFPPAGRGIVTKVRVKAGPITGPMQIVVEQALRQNNPADPGHPTYACCKAIQLSQVFTPTPNAITEVPVRLSVRQDIAPDPASGLFVDQHLALSVLAPNVPIPANLEPNNPNVAYGVWFPAWTLGQERANPYGGQGAVVLFNADWQSCPGAAAAQSAKKKKKKKKTACGVKRKKKKKRK